MELHYKLRELRLKHNLTQAEVAEHLGISTQTVSKWERGLLFPDVRHLPALAVLYRTSIDSIFDMQSYWDEEHRTQFFSHIEKLHQTGDKEGVFWAWISQIERQPDRFSDYVTVMIYTLQNGLFEDVYINRLLLLTEYIRRNCHEDDIRNEVYRTMLQITSHAQNPALRQKAKRFYKMLPRLAHSREFFFDIIEDSPEAHHAQALDNLHRIAGLVNHCILRLITPEMSPKEKIQYHKKAVTVLETIWEDCTVGFYHLPLLYNYYSIISYSVTTEEQADTELYFKKLQNGIEQHLLYLSQNEKERKDTLVSLKRLIHHIKNNPSITAYREYAQAWEKALCERKKNE